MLGVIVQNKTDLPADTWRVDTSQGRQLAELNGMRFAQTSGLTGEGISALFMDVIKDVLRQREEQKAHAESPQLVAVKPSTVKQQSKRCCLE